MRVRVYLRFLICHNNEFKINRKQKSYLNNNLTSKNQTSYDTHSTQTEERKTKNKANSFIAHTSKQQTPIQAYSHTRMQTGIDNNDVKTNVKQIFQVFPEDIILAYYYYTQSDKRISCHTHRHTQVCGVYEHTLKRLHACLTHSIEI